MADETQKISSGVQSLINRLKDEGVQAGQQEADRIVEEARKLSSDILSKARTEADRIREEVQREIETERGAAHEALQMAVRDSVLKLREEINSRFAAQVSRLVSAELADKDFLKQLILIIAGRSVPEKAIDQQVELLVSEALFSEDTRQTEKKVSAKKGKDPLVPFILGISDGMLREGFTVKPSANAKAGLRVRLVGEDLEIDLTDQTLTELILKYMVPRLRAIAEGITE